MNIIFWVALFWFLVGVGATLLVLGELAKFEERKKLLDDLRNGRWDRI